MMNLKKKIRSGTVTEKRNPMITRKIWQYDLKYF